MSIRLAEHNKTKYFSVKVNNIESNNKKLRLKLKGILLLEIGLSIEESGSLYTRTR